MDEKIAKSMLKNLGLSEWEAIAYMRLVKYGPKTAVELSRLSTIARSKTYEVATRLRRKGFVMKVPAMPTKGVTQKFVVIEPKKVFLSKASDIEELSEYLGGLYKNPARPGFPKINLYTNREAIKELFYDIMKNSRFFYFYLIDLNLSSILGYSFEHILRIIKKKKHYFLLEKNNDLEQFSKSLGKYSFTKEKGGMGYVIASDRIILDLYKSQHVILEIVSDEAVKTLSDLYFNKIKKKR